MSVPNCSVKPGCPRLDEARARALVARYDRRVPRYTSYPTAARFTPAVGQEQHRAWLAAVDLGEPVSLYLHVPFCDRLCWYCGCHTGVVNRRGPIEAYAAALVAEIAAVAAALPGRARVSAIHFGGGTPNMLAPADLDAIFGALNARFDVLPTAEIAVELDPRVLDATWIAAARRHGVNRASLGVQDLDPIVQAAINRRQPLATVAWAVTELHESGISSLNLDVMYGLPHQSVESLLRTIEQVAALEPERISLFGYAHVPWMKPAQKLIPDAALPDALVRYEQQREAALRLEQAGYRRIGLDHFARADDALAEAEYGGRLRRNFQGYTTDAASTLIGLGASSISHLPGGYVQNHAATPAWTERIAAGELATARGVAVQAEDRLRGEIIERLMCDLAVDLRAICARHDSHLGAIVTPAVRAALDAMARDGLVDLARARGGTIEAVAVTELGRPFVRVAAAAFDAYLAPEATRHSAAV